MQLHHIGIVVDKLAEATPLFEIWMGARRIGGVVEDEAQSARIQLFLMGDDTLLEVVEPIPGANDVIHRTGTYHLCFTVPDIDAETRRLSHLGTVVSHPAISVPFFDNRRMAFLATTSGQLLELLEDPAAITQ